MARTDRLDCILDACETFDQFHGDGVKRADEHIGWDRMVQKLMAEGHSKASAERIAGYINKKKYG